MTFCVSVPRAELQDALKALKVVKPKSVPEAVILFSGEELEIVLSGVTVRAAAAGTWPGAVRVGGHFLLGLAHAAPAGDPGQPVMVSVEEGRLKIAGTSCACTVENSTPPGLIKISLNAALPEKLFVRQTQTDDEIARSGLTQLIEQAEEERDKLVTRAAEVLRPLAIQAQDLRNLVDDCIRRQHSA